MQVRKERREHSRSTEYQPNESSPQGIADVDVKRAGHGEESKLQRESLGVPDVRMNPKNLTL
jgi:hypothetical protein